MVSSRWAVYGLCSALLMGHFHAGWPGGPGVAAPLREAQRWLREGILNGPYLRAQVLPGLLGRLEDADLRRACDRAADDHAW